MIEFTIDKKQLEELNAKLRAINPKIKGNALGIGFRALVTETESYLKTNSLSGQALKVRSGRLRASIGSNVIDNDGNLTGYVGSGVRQGDRVPYANIHETGGVIKPRTSKYLAIPLPAAKTAGGDVRKKPRDYANTFVAKTGSGNLIIFQRKGKMGLGAIVALFLLKKSVTIPARYYMTKTVDAMAPRALEIMTRSVERQLEGKAI